MGRQHPKHARHHLSYCLQHKNATLDYEVTVKKVQNKTVISRETVKRLCLIPYLLKYKMEIFS
jgi:hypothetical protein